MWDNLSEFLGNDPGLLADIKAYSSLVTLPSGTCIFCEGDNSDAVYFILEGEARAVRYSGGGIEVWLDHFSAGDVFGEMAPLVQEPRTADMYTVTQTVLAKIPGKAFLDLISNNGAFGHRICRLLARRVQKTTRRLFEQATLSATARISAELLRMANTSTAQEEDIKATVIRKMPTITDMAVKLNIARETVSRTISKLKESGVLERSGAGLLILKPHTLVQCLNE